MPYCPRCKKNHAQVGAPLVNLRPGIVNTVQPLKPAPSLTKWKAASGQGGDSSWLALRELSGSSYGGNLSLAATWASDKSGRPFSPIDSMATWLVVYDQHSPIKDLGVGQGQDIALVALPQGSVALTRSLSSPTGVIVASSTGLTRSGELVDLSDVGAFFKRDYVATLQTANLGSSRPK